MSQHLSSREVSQWMIGERTPQQEQHVRQCPECGAELARMEAALGLFRGSVRHWSDRQVRVFRPLTPTRGSRGYPARPLPVRWALAAATLLLLAAVPIYRNVQVRQRQAEIARADALLLEQVDAEVSRAVPRPMEPLVKLVSWDFTSTDERDQNRRDKTRNEEIR
jgi:anti-sigma factor RsiW